MLAAQGHVSTVWAHCPAHLGTAPSGLLGVCNEYLVFAEQLLESGGSGPGLTQSNLFALVACKDFHLSDFENIARRASDLLRRSRHPGCRTPWLCTPTTTAAELTLSSATTTTA